MIILDRTTVCVDKIVRKEIKRGKAYNSLQDERLKKSLIEHTEAEQRFMIDLLLSESVKPIEIYREVWLWISYVYSVIVSSDYSAKFL